MDTGNSGLVDLLQSVDTPTTCNALVNISKDYRGKYYTLDPVIAANPSLGSRVGYALTATICSSLPSMDSPETLHARRFAYYRYLSEAPRPGIVVMQDRGPRRGFGCIWGEINVALHKGLGVSAAVTDGAIRDLGAVAPDFHLLGGNVCPGSGFAHFVDFGKPVEVFGLRVQPGDLVQVDRHGCVVVPTEAWEALPAAIERILKREREFLSKAAEPGFNYERLTAAWETFEAAK